MPVNYSALMSVYYKEHPDYLRQSMQSIYDQTVPTGCPINTRIGCRYPQICGSNSGRICTIAGC